jgi:hypothetical protein
MEDEHQSTLKKKIQILFQLGKWSDVVKLCESYGEKYGKEAEIETIRYKSERHMGVPSPAARPGAKESQVAPENKAKSADAVADETGISDPTIPLIPPLKSDEFSGLHEEKLAYDSAPEANDLEIDDVFSDDELVISDPFADDNPGFSLAPEQLPVIIAESLDDQETIGPVSQDIEMEGRSGADSDSPPEESEPDFSDIGAMSIDAEPDLITAAPGMNARPVPEAESATRTFSTYEEKKIAGPPPPAVNYFDGSSEIEETKLPRSGEPTSGEKAKRPPAPAPDMTTQKAPGRKRVFGLKLMLLVVVPLVAAAALWLALSGKLNFSGAEEPRIVPQPVAQPAARRRPKPVKPAVSPELAAQLAEQDKQFAEKLRQVEDLDRQGDMLKAWAVLLEAKKIKVTEPLLQLEEQLKRKMHEAEEQARKEQEVAQNQLENESQAFAKAEAEDTLVAWNVFLSKYPNGEMTQRAERRITALEKKVQQNVQLQLQARVQQAQKVWLRAFPSNLSPADIAGMARRLVSPPAQFESHEHGGASVIIDFATGLMWTLWNKPMAYDKAKWWANRVTAGYGGWRLPTAEEALSLLQADRGLYAGLADFAVWTGDSVSDQPRTSWALRLPGGQFIAAANTQICYVWAVRKAGK